MSVKAILFDAYGTLLDIHSATGQHHGRLGAAADAISALWRQKQLEYSWTLTMAQRYRPFDELTAVSLDFALAQHHVSDPALRRDLLGAYRHLMPYSEVPAALETLARRGLRLGILSNGAEEMLRTAFTTHELDNLLNPLLSVDSIKIYKPDPRVYAMATRHLGLPPNEIGFVSSNGWDAMGAAAFGFKVFWLQRQVGPVEYDLAMLTARISSLAELSVAL
ncbi:haloacid dehalogenase type II [Dongia sp.]|uniref:haloacid dehalogenase type II n=1 Tax=Dongia sp. TaxID=1977262 RepID=UPI0035B2C277